MKLLLHLSVILTTLTSCDTMDTAVTYHGDSVIRALPQSDTHIELLRHLNKNSSRAWKFDFWKQPTHPYQHVDIHSNPTSTLHVQNILSSVGMKPEVIIADVQQLITEQKQRPKRSERLVEGKELPSITDMYHTYSEIVDWLAIAVEVCGSNCQLENIGYTSEGRPMMLIKIITDPSRPSVWVDAGLHAREWVAPSTALYFVSKLIRGLQGGDEEGKEMAELYNWYILPVANPDGYVFSWTTDRLWRKTRSSNYKSGCKGTDANRNWNFFWGGFGTSSNPCVENYRGSHPFSEPEARAMANYIWSLREQLLLYLTLHSYGQYWLLPWGFSYAIPSDYQDLMNMGYVATEVLGRKYGADYTVGTASRLLYRAAGGSDDWVKGKAGVKYSYTVELGDKGRHGFLLPAHYINSTGLAMADAVHTLLLQLSKKL